MTCPLPAASEPFAPGDGRGSTARPWLAGWWLAGGVVGTAVQLLQARLWPVAVYLALMLGGLLAMRWRVRSTWLFAGVAIAFGCTGWRAGAYLGQGLSPALEGRDIAVVGRVASLPQTDSAGERFEFVVEQATLSGEAVSIPARLLLGWYVPPADEGASARLPGLWAGERWAFEVRLKRPHGSRNPHGFDRERWLWEHGIGATGYVRLGTRDAAPRRLGQTPWHPVDRVRQAISRAIAERVDDPRAAGVLAALVVGEQSAIVG